MMKARTEMKEIVIPKEQAVFWLDKSGYWHNDGGKFRKKKIIDLFHQSIGKDDNGYFVSQTRDGVLEKVYFPYEDTALFVFSVQFRDPVMLELNTGTHLPLRPENLFINNDNLYLTHDNDRIKFSERALMQISSKFIEDGSRLMIKLNGHRFCIPDNTVATG
jgi:hypothetical protein